MKGGVTRIILIHVAVWLALSVGYCFLAEPVTKLLLPDVHDIAQFLFVLLVGLAVIFVVVLGSLALRMVARGKEK